MNKKKSYKSKITILTKVKKTQADYPDIIKIDTLTEDETNFQVERSGGKADERSDYFLMTETGEEIKGTYSHIIKLYNVLGGTIIRESDYPNFTKPINDKKPDVYKVFQEHFLAT